MVAHKLLPSLLKAPLHDFCDIWPTEGEKSAILINFAKPTQRTMINRIRRAVKAAGRRLHV